MSVVPSPAGELPDVPRRASDADLAALHADLTPSAPRVQSDTASKVTAVFMRGIAFLGKVTVDYSE